MRDSTLAPIADLRTDVGGRLDWLEEGLRTDRRDVAGMLVMTRAAAGHFEERVTNLDERMAKVDGLRPRRQVRRYDRAATTSRRAR